MNEANEGQVVDDRGTSEQQGRALLKRLRDEGFGADDAKFAVALGRPVEEVTAWMTEGDSGEPVDDDIIMKARGIATQRGINLD